MRLGFLILLLQSTIFYAQLFSEQTTIVQGNVIVHPAQSRNRNMEKSRAQFAVDDRFEKYIIDSTLGVCCGIAVGDVDQDNDLDIVISQPYDSLVIIYKYNPADTSFEKQIVHQHESESKGDTVNIYQVELADMNNDGMVDIVFGQFDDGLYVMYNEGQASFPDTVKISSKITWMFDIIDLNEDGLLDIVGNNNSWNTETWYIQQGANRSFSENLIDNDCGDAYGIDAVDLDGDGDIDIVQGSANWYDDLYWYENDGDEAFTKNSIDEFINDPLDVVCVDMDKDNDIDIVVTATDDDELRWYENDGSEQFSVHTATDSVDGMWFIGVADLDSNQTLDILTANRNSDYLLWFSYDDESIYTPHQIDGSIQYPQNFVIRDFNMDNNPDIALVSGQSSSGDFTRGQLTIYLTGITKASVASRPNECLPQSVILHQNYPNPFNPVTTIEFDLPAETHVNLKIFDLLGREIATLMDKKQDAGRHAVTFDASTLTSGLYFYRIKTENSSRIRKLVVAK